jgi:hypothetical protein
MAVKMPVLGQPARRKSSGRGGCCSSSSRWPREAGCGTASSAPARRWRRSGGRPAPVISAPGSTVVPGVVQAPRAAGPDRSAVPVGAHRRPLEAALVSGAGGETGLALTQVVTRVLDWWVAVPADLRKGDMLEVVYEPQPEPGSAAALRGSAGVPWCGEPLVDAVRLQSARPAHLRGVPLQAGGGSSRGSTAPTATTWSSGSSRPPRRLGADHSLLKDGRKHKGVDFKTPVGTPVRRLRRHRHPEELVLPRKEQPRGDRGGGPQEGHLPPPLGAAAPSPWEPR